MSEFDNTITCLIDSIEVTATDCLSMEKEAQIKIPKKLGDSLIAGGLLVAAGGIASLPLVSKHYKNKKYEERERENIRQLNNIDTADDLVAYIHSNRDPKFRVDPAVALEEYVKYKTDYSPYELSKMIGGAHGSHPAAATEITEGASDEIYSDVARRVFPLSGGELLESIPTRNLPGSWDDYFDKQKTARDDSIKNVIEIVAQTIREDMQLEKEAFIPAVAAAGRAILPAAKTFARPLMNSLARIPGAQRAGQAIAGGATGQLAKAKQWSGAISSDWAASGAAGKGLMASTSSALQAGMKVSPGLTTGAIAAPAYALGTPGRREKNKNIAQPGTIMIQADENELMDKQAFMEDQDPLDLMVKGIISGAAIGAGLALNSKFKGVKLRNNEYLEATEGLRNIGNSVAPFYEKSVQNLERTRKTPVSTINDIRLQNLFRSTLDDITKYIEETKKNLSSTELNEFKSKLQETYNNNKVSIPLGVRDEIWEIIEKI